MLAALRESGGIWFGWSGDLAEAGAPMPKVLRTGNIIFITIDLSQVDFDGYYGGFAIAPCGRCFTIGSTCPAIVTGTSPIGGSIGYSLSNSIPICAMTTWSGSTTTT